MTGIRRITLTAAPFAIAAIAYAGILLTHHDRLPEQLATHFSWDGTANGFMGRGAALWFGTGLLVTLGALFTVLALAAKDSPASRATTVIGACTAVTLGYPLILTAVVNTDAQDPAAVRLPLWHLAVPLAGCLATVAVLWRLLGREGRPAPGAGAPSLPLADGEAVAWSRTVASRLMLLVGIAVTAGGLLILVFGPWWAGLPQLLVAPLCLAFARIRVTVDRRGLTVASAFLPGPRLAVPLGGITGADSVRVDPVGDFGGWGYRIRPNRQGVLLRSGEALSVLTAGGREYVVTVDDSATAAALLNGLVNRHAKGLG